MRHIESVSCEISNGMVYIYDQDGNMVETLSYPDLENAYSTGSGIVIETESMSYIYSVRGDYLELTGDRFRANTNKPPPEDLIPNFAKPGYSPESSQEDNSYERYHIPVQPSRNSTGGCLLLIIAAVVISVVCNKCSSSDNKARSESVSTTKQASFETSPTGKSEALEWAYYKSGGHYVCSHGSFTANGKDWHGAELFLRKHSGKQEVFVSFNTSYPCVQEDLSKAAYIFGEGESIVGKWHPSTDCKAIFYGENAVDLINAFRNQKKFAVAFRDHKDVLYLASFNVNGAFQKYCSLDNKTEVIGNTSPLEKPKSDSRNELNDMAWWEKILLGACSLFGILTLICSVVEKSWSMFFLSVLPWISPLLWLMRFFTA